MIKHKEKSVICLMGPTAAGKTALACELVQKRPFEIVSIDSGMIYRGMDIGTAKPSADVLAQAPHHLIDIIDPPEHYSVAACINDVTHCCEQIFSRGNTPLLVGGTMMYFKALQSGLAALPAADKTVREEILQQAATSGWSALYQQLQRVDSETAVRLHPNDWQRIQRALEVFYTSGIPLSHYLKSDVSAAETLYRFWNIRLMPTDRHWLHQRIAERFDLMLTQGLIDEVTQLMLTWNLDPICPAMRTVGYRQVLGYLQGDYDQATLRAKAIAATRQLAKRQLTWLRHWPDGDVLDPQDERAVLEWLVAL